MLIDLCDAFSCDKDVQISVDKQNLTYNVEPLSWSPAWETMHLKIYNDMLFRCCIEDDDNRLVVCGMLDVIDSNVNIIGLAGFHLCMKDKMFDLIDLLDDAHARLDKAPKWGNFGTQLNGTSYIVHGLMALYPRSKVLFDECATDNDIQRCFDFLKENYY